MAKKDLPATMDKANQGKQPPFVPTTMKVAVGPPQAGSTAKGSYQEAGLYLHLYDYSYAGLNQTAQINIRIPKPV